MTSDRPTRLQEGDRYRVSYVETIGREGMLHGKPFGGSSGAYFVSPEYLRDAYDATVEFIDSEQGVLPIGGPTPNFDPLADEDRDVFELRYDLQEARAEADTATAERDKLANDLGDLSRIHGVVTENEDNLRHAGHRIAGLFNRDPEDHQIAGVLRDVAEELIAWRADSSKVPDGWQSLVWKGWSVGARPVIPADAVVLPDNWETQIRQALHARAYDISEAGPLPGTSSHDRDADRCADEIAGDVVVLINDWMSDPVPGSDTTEDGGDR